MDQKVEHKEPQNAGRFSYCSEIDSQQRLNPSRGFIIQSYLIDLRKPVQPVGLVSYATVRAATHQREKTQNPAHLPALPLLLFRSTTLTVTISDDVLSPTLLSSKPKAESRRLICCSISLPHALGCLWQRLAPPRGGVGRCGAVSWCMQCGTAGSQQRSALAELCTPHSSLVGALAGTI